MWCICFQTNSLASYMLYDIIYCCFLKCNRFSLIVLGTTGLTGVRNVRYVRVRLREVPYFFLECVETVYLALWPLSSLFFQPRVMNNYDCEDIGGMICNGNRSSPRKRVPVPLGPPQIPHYLTWARTWAVSVGYWRLTAWATARPWTALRTPTSHNPPAALRRMWTSWNTLCRQSGNLCCLYSVSKFCTEIDSSEVSRANAYVMPWNRIWLHPF
jgi:hypothetical protein